jgi:hypothetical protein
MRSDTHQFLEKHARRPTPLSVFHAAAQYTHCNIFSCGYGCSQWSQRSLKLGRYQFCPIRFGGCVQRCKFHFTFTIDEIVVLTVGRRSTGLFRKIRWEHCEQLHVLACGYLQECAAENSAPDGQSTQLKSKTEPPINEN